MTAIVTLTLNPVLDFFSQVDRVVPDRKLRCAAPMMVPGGGGVNVARAAHALGGEALAVWTSGGPLGGAIAARLEGEGIASVAIPIAGDTREGLIVREEGSGQQYRFGFPGPELSAEEVAACVEAVRRVEGSPQFVVVSGSMPPGVPPDLFHRLRARIAPGARLVVDTSGPPLEEALDAGVYLAKPNLREFGQLVGRDLADDRALESAAREVLGSGGAAVVLISLGAAGALLATPEGVARIRAPTVPIRSRVGAGDSTVAGMLVALTRGLPVREAARFGVAAGAAAVMNPGPSLCRREDTERLFAAVAQ